MDDLLEASAHLSAKDRRELLARLSLAAQAPDSEEARDVDMWASAVHEALEAHAGSGSGAVPGPGVIRGLVGASKAWAPVRDFMQSSKLALLKVTERRSVYGLLARLVVQDSVDFCRWSRAPLGPKVVAQRCEHIAGTFDQSFPNYLASGLAPMVARALVAGGCRAMSKREPRRTVHMCQLDFDLGTGEAPIAHALRWLASLVCDENVNWSPEARFAAAEAHNRAVARLHSEVFIALEDGVAVPKLLDMSQSGTRH